MQQRRYWIDVVIGLFLGALAGIIYLATLSPDACPGIYSAIIARYTGLLPKLSPDHPIWSAIARMLASSGEPAGLSYRLNAFSAICGAACIWLLYDLMSSAVYLALDPSPLSRIRRVIASRLSGIASALSLTLCMPFWTISTRAHMLSFHVLFLLILTRMLITYVASGRMWITYVFAFLYGISIVEFPTMIPLAVLFGPFLLIMVWRNDELRPSTALGLLVCGVAGLCLYLPSAWSFYGSTGSDLRGYNNWWQVVWIMWRDQVHVVSSSLPPVGGLLIIICAVIPWLTALFVARRALNEEKDWAFYILHVVMTALAIPVMLDIEYVSPWHIVGPGRPMITPYVLTASLFGYLVAYWFLAPYTWISDPDEDEKAKIFWRRALGPVLIAPMLFFTALLPAKNYGKVVGGNSKIAADFARATVKSMQGREWLISHTPFFDDPIIIAAHELGQSVNILDLRRGDDPIYMKYIASLLDDISLKNLTSVSVLNLCQEWLNKDPSAADSVAILDDPNMWIASDYTPVPNQTLYLGTKDPKKAADKMVSNNTLFWNKLPPSLYDTIDTNSRDAVVGYFVVNHLGTIANNSGVFLEDIGRQDDAAAAYLKALQIDDENISAMLNLVLMINHGYKLPNSDDVMQRYNTFIESPERHAALWHLARTYGYVRSPSAFVEMGLNWALSGERGLAISGIERAMAMLPEERRDPLRLNLAELYFKQHQPAKSEDLYAETLKNDPHNKGALLGMARLSSMRGDFDAAKKYLIKALTAGVPKPRIALEYAVVHLRAGNLSRARVLLEDLLQEYPNLVPARILMAETLLQQKDFKALREQIQELAEAPETKSYAMILKGMLAVMELDWKTAGDAFQASYASDPSNMLALENLLRIDWTLRRRTLAREHTLALLRLDPGNPLANQIMASFELEQKHYERAEDFLRKSLKRKRDYFALNDLAWTLCKMGKLKEAEKLAREALTISDSLFTAWDTLGVILAQKGDLEDALECLEKARALSHDATPVLIHLGDLHLRKKNLEKVRELITILTPRMGMMSENEKEELSLLKRETRQ